MKSLAENDVKSGSFWLRHPDSTQAAVHLALQWLAYVYPASELYLDETLRQALPYADADLNRRWRQFLEQNDVDEHVKALQWLSNTLSSEQVPFLVESCWRLLLVSHDMPSHVPLALRLMARILDVPEDQILEIGRQVQREIQDVDDAAPRAPLLPEDPRYLDRVEWRLYGDNDPIRPTTAAVGLNKQHQGWRYFLMFVAGGVFGALLVSYMVWGPMQLGRQPVPRMSHLLMSEDLESPSEASGGSESTVNGIGTADSGTTEPGADASSGTKEESLVTEADPETAEQEPEVPSEEVGENASDLAGGESTQEPIIVTELPAQSPDVLMTVSASVLNVRAEPSIDSEVVMKLGEGARVWVSPDQSVGDWQHIRVDDVSGFASGRYLEPVN